MQAPITFFTALQSGNLLTAIGAAAASVAGPTTDAAAAAIAADGTLVAPRALNAFEVGVVGLLDVVPAVADGLPGVAAALESARRDTFAALNAPIVPNPAPLARPEGIVQVAVVAAINVVAAVIFPAFNDVLAGAFQIPDAVARELAATGDRVRAAGAGAVTAAKVVTSAAGAIAESVVTGVRDVRAAAHSPRGKVATQARVVRVVKPAGTAVSTSDEAVRPPHRSSTAAPRSPHRGAKAGGKG